MQNFYNIDKFTVLLNGPILTLGSSLCADVGAGRAALLHAGVQAVRLPLLALGQQLRSQSHRSLHQGKKFVLFIVMFDRCLDDATEL